MNPDALDRLFKNLQDSFDIENPSNGHEVRFLEKLKAENQIKTLPRKNKFRRLAMAASLVFFIGLGFLYKSAVPSLAEQVVQISPEIAKSELYFSNIIQQEINKLKKEKSPATQKIVEDAMLQLSKLERDYHKLEEQLVAGGNSKLLLSAMITNFQTRIDLLSNVLAQIEEIKKIQYENEII